MQIVYFDKELSSKSESVHLILHVNIIISYQTYVHIFTHSYFYLLFCLPYLYPLKLNGAQEVEAYTEFIVSICESACYWSAMFLNY